MRQPAATIGAALHFFVDFGIVFCAAGGIAAVVIRQPYNPTIGFTVPRWVCRAVTPWQPLVKLWQPIIVIIPFTVVEIAAAVIRQPYNPTIGFTVSRWVCRAVTPWQPLVKLWQPHIIRPFWRIPHNDNQMNMIRHHHKFRDKHIVVDCFDFPGALPRPFPNFRQFHPTINHIAKIQIMVFRAKGHEIPSTIVSPLL